MSKDEIELIGKKVKDMYGAYMGKVLGTITDTDGSIQTVGIECGSEGLKQVPYEQLVVQGDIVIFIPKWRLDSQRLLREKGLTVRRLKALIDIVSENDDMQDDAAIIHEKYKSKLASLEETEKQINASLESRIRELNELLQSVKVLIFDAKVQYKSNEISESKFDLVQTHTSDIIEHINHEKEEIINIQSRIADLSLEDLTTIESPKQRIHSEARSFLGSASNEARVQTTLPVPPTQEPAEHVPRDTQHHVEAVSHNPVTAQTNPVTAQTNPVTAQTNPVTAQTNPVTAQTNPVTAQTNPVTAQTNPVTAQTNPVTAQTNPVTAQTNPTSGQNKPVAAKTSNSSDESDWLSRMEAQ